MNNKLSDEGAQVGLHLCFCMQQNQFFLWRGPNIYNNSIIYVSHSYTGRGKKAEPEPMEESSESEEEEVVKPKGRGRGRGKRTAEEAFGKKEAKVGRGGGKKKK